MNPVTIVNKTQAIVYDGDRLPSADAALFDPSYWGSRQRLEGKAPGRGTTHFIDAPFGPAALRRYLRGGWVARIIHDRYWFNGYERSRPFREFHLLRQMLEHGLRVPAPIAALCTRDGRFYRGALLTSTLEHARPLPDHFDDASFDWGRLGSELREFHDAGMDHADLNARNILVHEQTGQAWLLDFDRSTFHPGKPVNGQANLARLNRSLAKLWTARTPELEACWNRLVQGYGA